MCDIVYTTIFEISQCNLIRAPPKLIPSPSWVKLLRGYFKPGKC